MIVRPLSRRVLLRGAGVAMALPFLEAMTPSCATAAVAPVQRFIAFFYPNGTDPPKWNPAAGQLVGTSLPECLRDLNGGFAAEGIWPAETASFFQDVTVVTGIDHQGVCAEIHNPSMALSAYSDGSRTSMRACGPGSDQPSTIGSTEPPKQLPGTGAVAGCGAAVAGAAASSSSYFLSQRVWYSRGVSTLPAPGKGTLSHSAESVAGRWPMYQTTGTADGSLSCSARTAEMFSTALPITTTSS